MCLILFLMYLLPGLASCYHEGVGVEKNPELVQHLMQRQAQLVAAQQDVAAQQQQREQDQAISKLVSGLDFSQK